MRHPEGVGAVVEEAGEQAGGKASAPGLCHRGDIRSYRHRRYRRGGKGERGDHRPGTDHRLWGGEDHLHRPGRGAGRFHQDRGRGHRVGDPPPRPGDGDHGQRPIPRDAHRLLPGGPGAAGTLQGAGAEPEVRAYRYWGDLHHHQGAGRHHREVPSPVRGHGERRGGPGLLVFPDPAAGDPCPVRQRRRGGRGRLHPKRPVDGGLRPGCGAPGAGGAGQLVNEIPPGRETLRKEVSP